MLASGNKLIKCTDKSDSTAFSLNIHTTALTSPSLPSVFRRQMNVHGTSQSWLWIAIATEACPSMCQALGGIRHVSCKWYMACVLQVWQQMGRALKKSGPEVMSCAHLIPSAGAPSVGMQSVLKCRKQSLSLCLWRGNLLLKEICLVELLVHKQSFRSRNLPACLLELDSMFFIF